MNSALTDALIAGIAKGSKAYKLVGSYVTSPLRWHVHRPVPSDEKTHDTVSRCRAVITGSKDSSYEQISDLQGTTLGISRHGR